MNIPTHTSNVTKILKLSDQYKLQVSNYIFQLLHSNIDEEIESSLLIKGSVECKLAVFGNFNSY